MEFKTKTKPNKKLVDTEKRLAVARGGGVSKMSEGGQKVQTSSYKINVMGI